MNAAIRFHFSAWGPFSAVPVNDPQRSEPFFASARAIRGGHRQSRQPTR